MNRGSTACHSRTPVCLYGARSTESTVSMLYLLILMLYSVLRTLCSVGWIKRLRPTLKACCSLSLSLPPLAYCLLLRFTKHIRLPGNHRWATYFAEVCAIPQSVLRTEYSAPCFSVPHPPILQNRRDLLYSTPERERNNHGPSSPRLDSRHFDPDVCCSVCRATPIPPTVLHLQLSACNVQKDQIVRCLM